MHFYINSVKGHEGDCFFFFCMLLDFVHCSYLYLINVIEKFWGLVVISQYLCTFMTRIYLKYIQFRTCICRYGASFSLDSGGGGGGATQCLQCLPLPPPPPPPLQCLVKPGARMCIKLYLCQVRFDISVRDQFRSGGGGGGGVESWGLLPE